MDSPHWAARIRVLGLAIVAFCSACAPAVRSSPFSSAGHRQDRISVVVENNLFDDVTVYLESTRGRLRLGRVGGCSKSSFVPLPEVVGTAGAYELVAVHSGHRQRTASGPIEVVPGSTTIWKLGASASLSAVVIR